VTSIALKYLCYPNVQLRESCEFLGMLVTVGPCTLRAETFEFAIVGIETAVTAMKCALLLPALTFDESLGIILRLGTVARRLCKVASDLAKEKQGRRMQRG